MQDDDYLLLYNSEIAENDEVLKVLAEQLFTVTLDFASWFKPFKRGLQDFTPYLRGHTSQDQ